MFRGRRGTLKIGDDMLQEWEMSLSIWWSPIRITFSGNFLTARLGFDESQIYTFFSFHFFQSCIQTTFFSSLFFWIWLYLVEGGLENSVVVVVYFYYGGGGVSQEQQPHFKWGEKVMMARFMTVWGNPGAKTLQSKCYSRLRAFFLVVFIDWIHWKRDTGKLFLHETLA